MIQITKKQQKAVAIFMTKASYQLSDDFEKICRENSINEKDIWSILIFSTVSMVAQQIAVCCEDEEELLAHANNVKHQIIDIGCMTIGLRKNGNNEAA